jgi:hypothetical protein
VHNLTRKVSYHNPMILDTSGVGVGPRDTSMQLTSGVPIKQHTTSNFCRLDGSRGAIGPCLSPLPIKFDNSIYVSCFLKVNGIQFLALLP